MPRCLAAVSMTTGDVIGRCAWLWLAPSRRRSSRDDTILISRHTLGGAAASVVRRLDVDRRWFIGSGRVSVWYRSVSHQRGVRCSPVLGTDLSWIAIHHNFKIHRTVADWQFASENFTAKWTFQFDVLSYDLSTIYLVTALQIIKSVRATSWFVDLADRNLKIRLCKSCGRARPINWSIAQQEGYRSLVEDEGERYETQRCDACVRRGICSRARELACVSVSTTLSVNVNRAVQTTRRTSSIRDLQIEIHELHFFKFSTEKLYWTITGECSVRHNFRAVVLFPVQMTLWPWTILIVLVSPRLKWNKYDHPLPNNNAFVANKSWDFVTLTFDLWSCHTSRATRSTLPLL